MFKKAQFVVMLAALALSGALLVSFGNGPVQVASRVVGCSAESTRHCSLPKLAGATTSSMTDPTASQSDNGTLPVTSGGAVEASFTVVTSPGTGLGESWATPTANGGDGSGGSPTATVARGETSGAGDQTMRDGHSGTAVGVGPKSGGLSPGWALLIGAWAVGDVALGVFAFRYGWAGRRSLGLEEPGDSHRRPSVCEPGDQAT